jgi:hypothetical protein
MTFIIVLFLLSCSWITYFYVVNKSDVPITITVKYRKIEKPNYPAPTPEIEKRWEELEKKSCWYIGFKKRYQYAKKGVSAEPFSLMNTNIIKKNANLRLP